MAAESSKEFETSGLFIRFRYWVAKFIYDAIFLVLVRNEYWQEGLLEFSILVMAVRRLPFHSPSAIWKQLSSEWIQAYGPSKKRDGQFCEGNLGTLPLLALHFLERFRSTRKHSTKLSAYSDCTTCHRNKSFASLKRS